MGELKWLWPTTMESRVWSGGHPIEIGSGGSVTIGYADGSDCPLKFTTATDWELFVEAVNLLVETWRKLPDPPK